MTGTTDRTQYQKILSFQLCETLFRLHRSPPRRSTTEYPFGSMPRWAFGLTLEKLRFAIVLKAIAALKNNFAMKEIRKPFHAGGVLLPREWLWWGLHRTLTNALPRTSLDHNKLALVVSSVPPTFQRQSQRWTLPQLHLVGQ